MAHQLETHINTYFARASPYQITRTTTLSLLTLYVLFNILQTFRTQGVKRSVFRLALRIIKAIPYANSKLQQEQQKSASGIEDSLITAEQRDAKLSFGKLPATGVPSDELLSTLRQWQQHEQTHWMQGQVSGGIYHGADELRQVASEAYSMFSITNPLHPDVFPMIRKMESEVIAMTLQLFNGTTAQNCGVMTSGGTESILMACKSYRDRGRAERGLDRTAMVVANTVHAAFAKAAAYFDMEYIEVPVNPVTQQMDIKAARKAITRNTVMIVGSAPNYPSGIIDPIEELSKLAIEHKIGLHVDCCLGSFLIPLLSGIGYPVPTFDFRLPGVSTISADTHKYGYSPKGTSVLMFNSRELRHHMYFVQPDWTGGIYASPTMPGSRPGGLVAATWATLVHMGRDGYDKCAREIMSTRDNILREIRSNIPELKIIGDPQMSVISFTVNQQHSPALRNVNIYMVNEHLTKRSGWKLNALQRPAAIHICVTYMHINFWQKLIADLKQAVAEVSQHPEDYKSGSAAIYGMAESLPDPTFIVDGCKAFIDALTSTKHLQGKTSADAGIKQLR